MNIKDIFLRRLGAAALALTLLMNAAPLSAYAVNDSEGDGASASDSTDNTAVTTADNDSSVTALASNSPALDATAALLVSPDSGMVLYSKNADQKRYPASTTKIMTALLTLENVSNLDETVTSEAVDFENVTADSSNAGILLGEQVTVRDLLYALMLPSANEAAYMLARHVGGSWEQFVDMMNDRAAELGCTGTHFCNPCGLHEEDHYTTACDLYLIAKEAMKDVTFRDIVSTVQHRMAKTNLHEERIIYTTNQLIFSSFQPWSYANCLGIKTGHTSQAGNCFVGYAEYGDAKLFSVVLGCSDSSKEYPSVAASFTDTKKLCQWGFENFTSKTLARQGEEVTYTKVKLSTDTNQLLLTAKADVVALLPKDLDVKALELVEDIPEEVKAPVKAGDPIGTATYRYNGTDYGTVELVALNDISRSTVLFYADKLSTFFQSMVFKILLLAAAAFFILHIFTHILFGGVRRRRNRRKMRSRYNDADYQRRRRRK
nr:D-alanyl-D-alanine carboxypeptidase family protein [uncultured Agathobaculum sp.]